MERREPAELLRVYAAYVERFAALVCFGHRYFAPSKFVLPEAQSALWILPNRPAEPGGLRLGMLIPFSMKHSATSHIALLGTLIEPLSNASRHGEPPRSGEPGIFIHLLDELPEQIVVRIENLTGDRQMGFRTV